MTSTGNGLLMPSTKATKGGHMQKYLDELIRGEIAAVKSFDTVLAKVTDPTEKSTLEELKKDHAQAVVALKKYAHGDVLENTKNAGPWGTFATAFAGGASLFGDKAALKALKIGEEHGVSEYNEALADDSIPSELKNLIRAELLPNQHRHISTIERWA
jgi:Domain of unknown function (DUF2383)